MPPPYRSCLRTLLPFVSLNASVADLAYVSKESDSIPVPVQNRPWEWMEHLGERSVHETKDESISDTTLKNSTSLSLELFDTRAIGKRLVTDTTDDVNNLNYDYQKVTSALSMLQETSSVESIFKRDWRESRLSASLPFHESSHSELDDEVGALPNFTVPDRRSASSRMASPASSVRSRGSVQPMGSSMLHQSPTQIQGQRLPMSGSTASDAIDVDSLTTDVSHSFTSSSQAQGRSKRKATEDPDDEVQVVSLQNKQKGKNVAKPKAKKQTNP